MTLIECTTLQGQKKQIPKAELILRPAVYGIVMNSGKLLLLRMRHTGKYHLPGGGVDLGESLEEALPREISEEAGIDVNIKQLAHFEELFFYYDPSGNAYHGLHIYYLCQAENVQLLDDAQVDDGSAEKPRWVEIGNLQPQEFQSCGEKILEICSTAHADSGA